MDSEFHDPDYPAVVKQEAGSETWSKADRAREILKKEIRAEMQARENELSIIDERMWQARRLLHGLRCSLLKQQYGVARAEDARDPQARPQVAAILRNKQTRLHPSVRRLTNTSTVGKDEIFIDVNKVPNYVKAEDDSVQTMRRERLTMGECTSRPQESDLNEVKEQKPLKIPRHIEPELNKPVVTLDQSERTRQKHKYRIIIGNTSKYSPGATAYERCSHRWLLYVRGAERVLRSVTVGLHQSYSPHHIVRLKTRPFQVSRRGWGEFPARVELHFALPELNRPATVEHVIRLDKRCTGLQCLGAETIVDVWLYSNSEMIKDATPEDTTPESSQWGDIFSTTSTELDVDEIIIKPIKKTQYPDSDTGITSSMNSEDTEQTIEYNEDFMTALDDEMYEMENDVDKLEKKDLDEIANEDCKEVKSELVVKKEIVETHCDKIEENFSHIQNDHCYVPQKDLPLIRIQNIKKHRFDLGEGVSKMYCVRSAVHFLLSKIPLVSEDRDKYRAIFPFIVSNDEQFWAMSQTHRKYAEWSRAKVVNKILTKYFQGGDPIWRTKQILYFSRLHGYYPSVKVPWSDEVQWELHQKMKSRYPTSHDINSGSIFNADAFGVDSSSVKEPPRCQDSLDVDVVSTAEAPALPRAPSPPPLEPLTVGADERGCYYVEACCADIGIELRNEDVGNGYEYCAAHRVILSAVRSLVSELLRTALAESNMEDGTPPLWDIRPSGNIGLHHVYSALRTNDRMNCLSLDSLYGGRADYGGRL